MQKIILILLLATVFLQGCSNMERKVQWYQTKEEAINNGLEKEGLDRSTILSVEEVNGETIIFYEVEEKNENFYALGIAVINESNKGYSWYRSSAYLAFNSTERDYMSAGTTIETPRKQALSVLAGKVFDDTIKSVVLSGDGQERELQISDRGRLFYSIHEVPFANLEILPIR
ncbi:hypothetical protein [Anaerosolibacter sp.]|uniref:hypothetical protein n=1 Tax=Anaerosolibacter sp. TaxID=1872527 RepID=UPI0039EF2528